MDGDLALLPVQVEDVVEAGEVDHVVRGEADVRRRGAAADHANSLALQLGEVDDLVG